MVDIRAVCRSFLLSQWKLGWKPNNVDQHPEKCWYWNDTQIMRSFNAGIISPGNYIKNLQIIANPPHDIVAQGNLGKDGMESRHGMARRHVG
jgi:hypothetical protein